MPHHDGLPFVFQFPEEDTQLESQEHKALWDELELALWEDAACRGFVTADVLSVRT